MFFIFFFLFYLVSNANAMILVSPQTTTRLSASISMNAPHKMAAVESISASILMEATLVSVTLDTSLIPSKHINQKVTVKDVIFSMLRAYSLKQ